MTYLLNKIEIFLVLAVMGAAALQFDCENSTSINEDHVHYCCKHPEGHNNVLEACSKETGFKMPNRGEQSLVDLTADRAIAGTCFGKCVFDKLNFMNGDNLDMLAVKKYYANKYKDDPEYVKEMVNAFDHCHGSMEENTAKFLSKPMFKELAAEFCNPKPSVIWACVVRQFFHNCPAERWSKSDECKTMLDYSKACKNALVSM